MEASEKDRVGLCAGCAHARRVVTPRSTFWLCRLAATDPRFVKYPRLPVRACEGYEEGGEAPAATGAGETPPA